MLTNISGFSTESITPLMILAGFGMVMGNLISGRLSDRYTPGKVGTAAQALICLMLLLIFFLSPYKWTAAILMLPLHGRVVCRIQPRTNTDYPCGKRRRDVGGCLRTGRIQSGKCHWRLCRGLTVSEGYRYPALTGVPFALTGFILFLIFYKKYQARY